MFKTYKIQLRRDGIKNSVAITKFLARHHYLPSLPRGISKSFIFSIKGVIKGIALFGHPVGRLGVGILELKRFCLSEDLPKNSASWFMAKCMKYLKQDRQLSGIISYADPKQGHEGIIYKASNFKYLGKQIQGSPYVKIEGKEVYLQNLMKYPGYAKYRARYLKGALKLKRKIPKHKYYYKIHKEYSLQKRVDL